MEKKVVIDRARWRCGGDSDDPEVRHGGGDSALLNSEGFICATGFGAISLGDLSANDILNLGEPGEISRIVHPLNYGTLLDSEGEEVVNSIDEPHACPSDEWENMHSTDLSNKLIEANDDENMSLKEREATVAKLFNDAGIRVEYLGEYKRYNPSDWE